MLSNMAASLILHKKIKTTTAKAKALRIYIEPLLTKSKDDSTHSRRVVFSYLQSNDAVTELFREVSPKIADRPGGYTRILKTGTRIGDAADMCIIELVDYNENLLSAKQDGKAAAGHRKRRGGKKKSEDTPVTMKSASESVSAKPEKIEAKKSDIVVDESSPAKDIEDSSGEKQNE